MVWWVHLQVIFHPKKSIHSTSSEENHTYTIKQKLLDSPIMKQWERPHSYTVHFKEQMGQWREAVGQLPSQQPDQSCGTVAISTAWPKLWDSCHLNSLTKAVGQLPSQQPDQSCRTVAISTAWPKLWDSCHLNSLTKAVGQLPSQQPDQSCGTVATSTAWPKLWDSCHLNGPTKAVGQLPSQQPNQSCGTVAILTAWPKRFEHRRRQDTVHENQWKGFRPRYLCEGDVCAPCDTLSIHTGEHATVRPVHLLRNILQNRKSRPFLNVAGVGSYPVVT